MNKKIFIDELEKENQNSSSSENYGTITQILGSVIDVCFDEGKTPKILNALEIIQDDKNAPRQILEVAQHIGNDSVRTIAMNLTIGLKRGMKVKDLKHPISVPVGKKVLSRMFNVLGEPIDNKTNIF